MQTCFLLTKTKLHGLEAKKAKKEAKKAKKLAKQIKKLEDEVERRKRQMNGEVQAPCSGSVVP